MTQRVAIIGTGFFSQFHVDAWRRLDVDVVGVCSLDLDAAEEIAAGFPGARAFSDVDALIGETGPTLLDIVTPPPTHLDLIGKAIDARIPAICQKPFCGGLEGAEQAARIAADADVPIIVHENFRFQPWYTRIGQELNAGSLGDVYQGTFQLRPGDGQGPDAYLARQPYFQEMPRFLVHETLIHIIDVFRALFGEAVSVYADLRKLNPVIKGEDAGVLILEFENSRRAVIDGNRLADHAAENRRLVMGEMLIEGSDGVIRLNGDGDIFTRAHDSNDETQITYDWDNIGFGGDCVKHLCAHVLDGLNGDGAFQNTAADYLANLRIVDAVYRSDAEGRKLDVQ